MSLSIAWSDVCHVDIRHMHYRDAERVCAAVHEFARHGVGGLEHVSLQVSVLRARGGFALVRIEEPTIYVVRILPSSPLRRVARLL